MRSGQVSLKARVPAELVVQGSWGKSIAEANAKTLRWEGIQSTCQEKKSGGRKIRVRREKGLRPGKKACGDIVTWEQAAEGSGVVNRWLL